LKNRQERQRKARINYWDKMKNKVREHFLPFVYFQTLYKRLHMLKQGGKFVNDYTNELYQLVSMNDLVEIEEHLVARYLSGLR